jgi:SAM-dependent methyltransferase
MGGQQITLSERERAEVERSAAEARTTMLVQTDVDRYLNPPADSPHGLEHAFYLLGDVREKTVLDFGCGSGENLIPLRRRGANVIGIDISPDLIQLAQQRVDAAGVKVTLRVGSAYQTGLPDESVDVVFSMALVHHLDLRRLRQEIFRILRPGGIFIMKEPIRFSRTLDFLRKFLLQQGDISEFEHPLTREEMAIVTEGFTLLKQRDFRLPFVSIIKKVFPGCRKAIWNLDRWRLQHFPSLGYLPRGRPPVCENDGSFAIAD